MDDNNSKGRSFLSNRRGFLIAGAAGLATTAAHSALSMSLMSSRKAESPKSRWVLAPHIAFYLCDEVHDLASKFYAKTGIGVEVVQDLDGKMIDGLRSGEFQIGFGTPASYSNLHPAASILAAWPHPLSAEEFAAWLESDEGMALRARIFKGTGLSTMTVTTLLEDGGFVSRLPVQSMAELNSARKVAFMGNKILFNQGVTTIENPHDFLNAYLAGQVDIGHEMSHRQNHFLGLGHAQGFYQNSNALRSATSFEMLIGAKALNTMSTDSLNVLKTMAKDSSSKIQKRSSGLGRYYQGQLLSLGTLQATSQVSEINQAIRERKVASVDLLKNDFAEFNKWAQPSPDLIRTLG